MKRAYGIAILLAFAAPSAIAQTKPAATVESLQQRIEQLQAENASLRQQLRALQSPTTRPAPVFKATSARVEGPWIVTIIAGHSFEMAAFDAGVANAKHGSLQEIDGRLTEAKARYEDLDSAYDYVKGSDGKTVRKRVYGNETISSAKADVIRIEAERRRVAQDAARSERKSREAANRRLLTGGTSEGRTVMINATSLTAIAVADSMREGVTYKVTGDGRNESGVLTIDLRSALPVAVTNAPAVPPHLVKPTAPAPARPLPTPLSMRIGDRGLLPERTKIFQVIDEVNLLAQSDDAIYWVEGIPTDGSVDGQELKAAGEFEVYTTETYDTSFGTKTIFRLRPASSGAVAGR